MDQLQVFYGIDRAFCLKEAKQAQKQAAERFQMLQDGRLPKQGWNQDGLSALYAQARFWLAYADWLK